MANAIVRGSADERPADAGLLRAADSLDDLYQRIEPQHLTPGWIDRPAPIMGAKSQSEFLPATWHYSDVRDCLDAAGQLVDVRLAERRNLLLRNPMPGNEWATSRTLVCAYQMILPGEFAPSHRHSSNALRVIIDGEGTYSVVDGERMPMESGDVVLTPGGHFHGHGHEGKHPAYWLDCLDVPLNYLLEPMYFEPDVQPAPPVLAVVEESPFRFTRAMIERSLDAAGCAGDGRCAQKFLLPTASMPAIGLEVQRLAAGDRYAQSRAGANRIFSVMSGSGEITVGDARFAWSRGDTIVVPSGYWMGMTARQDALVLEMSDAPIMRFANTYFLECR